MGQQSGIQWKSLDKRDERGSAKGLLLRGVVLATYVIDDKDYPDPAVTDTAEPVAVYCDILCYTPIPGTRWIPLPKVMVSQDKGSMHNGRVWKPKAATIDVLGNKLQVDGETNPANFDGDHVLVGFLDGNKNQPIIIGGIPHPSHNIGNLDRSKGHRNRLKVADGDPDFFKHHGTFYGIDTNGDWLTDTTFANDGTLDATGHEANPPTDGKGAQKALLPQDAEKRTEWFDMSTPDSPISKAYESLKKTLYELSLGGATLKVDGKDATAKLVLGDGAKSAIIAEAWETFFDGAFKTWILGHFHNTAMGPSDVPVQASTFPAYSVSAATSSHVKFPNL